MTSEQLWTELESQVPHEAGIVRRRVHEASGRDIFIAVSHPLQERMLILSVSAEAIQHVTSLPETRAIKSSIVPSGQRFEVCVILTVPEMNAVFGSFVDDVIDSIACTPTDSDAVAVLISRFSHWQWLLAGQHAEGLGRSAAQGLYGELWVLSNLAMPCLGPSAVIGWTGPDRDNVDFQYQQTGLEVKTTAAHNPAAVRISNERQLNRSQFNYFFLVTLTLDLLHGGNGESLASLIERIRDQIAGTGYALLFADKLLQSGYLRIHEDRYVMPLYAIRELACFRVADDFPRISEETLSVGIGNVSYDLALSACQDWKVDPDVLVSGLQARPGETS